MLNTRRVIMLAFVALLAIVTFVYADTLVMQTSTLSGTVSSKDFIKEGASVKEGQVLLNIEGIAGNMPAARATADGTVAEVLVKPGDKISSGQVVAKIKPAK